MMKRILFLILPFASWSQYFLLHISGRGICLISLRSGPSTKSSQQRAAWSRPRTPQPAGVRILAPPFTCRVNVAGAVTSRCRDVHVCRAEVAVTPRSRSCKAFKRASGESRAGSAGECQLVFFFRQLLILGLDVRTVRDSKMLIRWRFLPAAVSRDQKGQRLGAGGAGRAASAGRCCAGRRPCGPFARQVGSGV